jgi:hypothetical protein
MNTTAKKGLFQQSIFKVIEETTGKPLSLVIMTKEILAYCDGDRDTALMLSHIIYWCDRGINPEGFIWKSCREWKEEIGLSQ